MSTGNYTIITRASGIVLTAAIYNNDHQNHVTNQNPIMTGAYSDSVVQMQTQTNPGLPGSESLPTSLAGELERIRYQLARLNGTTFWYDIPSSSLGHGRCQLSILNSQYVQLTPYNGNGLQIAGRVYPVPAGLGLQNNLVASTTVMYVYAYMTGPTMTLMGSATGPTPDGAANNIGVMVKADDGGKTLVGMVYTNSSGYYQVDATYHGVVSWFNRNGFLVGNTYSSATSSGAPVQMSPTLSALCWGDEVVHFSNRGTASSAVFVFGQTILAQDGSGIGTLGTHLIANGNSNVSGSIIITPTRSMHTFSVFGASDGANNVGWSGTISVSTR